MRSPNFGPEEPRKSAVSSYETCSYAPSRYKVQIPVHVYDLATAVASTPQTLWGGSSVNQGCTDEPPHKGLESGKPRPSTLDHRVRVRWAIDAGKRRKPGEGQDARQRTTVTAGQATGRPAGESPTAVADWPAYATEQRETVRQGLRILARIIARAHLRTAGGPEQFTPAPGPPPSAGEPMGLTHPATGATADAPAGRRNPPRPTPPAAPSSTTPVPREAARPGVSAHTTKLPPM